MFATVVTPNVIAMVLLLILLFSTGRISRRAAFPDVRIFLLMVGCNFLQCANEIFTYSIDGVMLPGFRTLILLSNTLLFVVTICFACLWVVYADYKIFESVERIKKRVPLIAMPAAIVIIGCLVNLAVPIFFEVTPANEYQRASLYFIPYALTYCSLLYGTVFIYRRKSQAKRYVFLPAVVFMAPIILGSAVQLAFYGYSTTWVGVSVALMAVCINLQNETSYIDGLSGTYTRTYLYCCLDGMLNAVAPGKKIAGIMMDVDGFKAINDELGHLVGDDAIRTVGKILLNSLPDACIAARYGGDEFIVLQEVASEDCIRATMKVIEGAAEEYNRIKGKPYALHFSMGCAVFDPENDTADSFLGRMDETMYEVKRARYALA